MIKGQYSKQKVGKWTVKKTDVFASVSRVSNIQSPLSYEEIKTDKILSKSHMVAMHMQGRFDITGDWYRIYHMLVTKNPKLKKDLAEFTPKKYINFDKVSI